MKQGSAGGRVAPAQRRQRTSEARGTTIEDAYVAARVLRRQILQRRFEVRPDKHNNTLR